MTLDQAVPALSALAHDHRLALFRLLVEAGPHGLAAGALAGRLGVAPSSFTFHVQALERAGLVHSRRSGRRVLYAADFSVMNALIAFLTENCCREGAGVDACPPAAAPVCADG